MQNHNKASSILTFICSLFSYAKMKTHLILVLLKIPSAKSCQGSKTTDALSSRKRITKYSFNITKEQ